MKVEREVLDHRTITLSQRDYCKSPITDIEVLYLFKKKSPPNTLKLLPHQTFFFPHPNHMFGNTEQGEQFISGCSVRTSPHHSLYLQGIDYSLFTALSVTTGL